MKRLWSQLLRRDDGGMMLMTLAFMVLAVPMVTGTLYLAGTVSKDSQVKTTILKGQYAAQGCTQYAYYRVSKEAGYVDSLVIGVPDVFNFDGCTITVTKVSEDEPLDITAGDIVLALDNSGSIDSNELIQLKEAANTIVEHFNPGMADESMRLGISRFRGNSVSAVGMTDIDIHGDGGFVYVDDAFRGTSEPSYADGDWNSSAGVSGGGLRVTLGGIDDTDITGMSGGWRTTFNLVSQQEVTLSFYYNLTQDPDYEIDEYSEVLVTVDAMQPGSGSNDYVATITGNGNGGSPETTGWQLFQVNLGSLNTGIHTLTVGGYSNKKTASDESTEVLIDDVQVTIACGAECLPFLDASYDTGPEGSVYVDDTFRGTSEPAYASGMWDASGGLSGGGLRVDLGGIDNLGIMGMSAGWQTSFNLASQGEVSLSFSYNLTQAANYESDEYGEVIVTVDAMQPGSSGNDYVARIYGNGNGGSAQSTGWQSFQVDLGAMSPGAHTLTIGGYSNKKTYADESTEALIDDVVLAFTCVSNCIPLLDEAFEGVTPLHDGINGLVQGAPDLSSGTNIVAGIDGGAAQFNTGLGDRVVPWVPNLMILITDGDDTSGNSDTQIADASADSGAEIFAVGVGTSISMPTLDAIASEPDADHVFTTSDFNGLLSIIDDIVAAVDVALGLGTLITIESVSPDGTVSQFEVVIPL